VTLDDFERRNSFNLTEFGSFQDGLRKSGWRYIDTFCGKNVDQKIKFLGIYHLWRYWQGITPSESVKVRHSRPESYRIR